MRRPREKEPLSHSLESGPGIHRGLLYPVAILLVLSVAACRAPPPVSIDSRRPPPSTKIDYHYVARGDTLYSIAWRYELNYLDLARANGLGPPFTIYPGQRLTLETNSRPPVRQRPVEQQSVVRQPAAKTPDPVKTVSSPPAPLATMTSGWRWSWPARGKISRHYDVRGVFKGINIDTRPGVNVEAAGPGVVVYAGSGLRGYGQLIIVKHSEIFLSAYAHNRNLLVREGQTVKAEQPIAEVGGDPGHSGRLYFEIRRDGKPVDPLKLLPHL